MENYIDNYESDSDWSTVNSLDLNNSVESLEFVDSDIVSSIKNIKKMAKKLHRKSKHYTELSVSDETNVDSDELVDDIEDIHIDDEEKYGRSNNNVVSSSNCNYEMDSQGDDHDHVIQDGQYNTVIKENIDSTDILDLDCSSSYVCENNDIDTASCSENYNFCQTCIQIKCTCVEGYIGENWSKYENNINNTVAHSNTNVAVDDPLDFGDGKIHSEKQINIETNGESNDLIGIEKVVEEANRDGAKTPIGDDKCNEYLENVEPLIIPGNQEVLNKLGNTQNELKEDEEIIEHVTPLDDAVLEVSENITENEKPLETNIDEEDYDYENQESIDIEFHPACAMTDDFSQQECEQHADYIKHDELTQGDLDIGFKTPTVTIEEQKVNETDNEPKFESSKKQEIEEDIYDTEPLHPIKTPAEDDKSCVSNTNTVATGIKSVQTVKNRRISLEKKATQTSRTNITAETEESEVYYVHSEAYVPEALTIHSAADTLKFLKALGADKRSIDHIPNLTSASDSFHVNIKKQHEIMTSRLENFDRRHYPHKSQDDKTTVISNLLKSAAEYGIFKIDKNTKKKTIPRPKSVGPRINKPIDIIKKNVYVSDEAMSERFSNFTHKRSFYLDPYHPIVQSSIKPGDRRLKSVCAKNNSIIEVDGPLENTNENNVAAYRILKRYDKVYKIKISSSSENALEKCLNYLKATFDTAFNVI